MVVRAAADDAETGAADRFRQRFRVANDLRLILLELRLQRLFERDRLRRDDVDERAALNSGEERAVEVLRVLGLAEHESGARSAQCLVRRRRHEVGVRHRRRMQPGRNESGDVRDVGHHQRAALVANLADPFEVDDARIRRRAADHEPRLVLLGQPLHLVVVDQLIVLFDVIRDHVEVASRVRQRMTVREMAAVRQVHPHDRVAGLEDGEVNRHVCLRAGVRLHVGVLGAEEFLGAIDGDVLDDVRRPASSVIPLPRISLGIFVREDGAHRGEHGARDVILRGDELERVVLPVGFKRDGIGDLAVDVRKRALEEIVSGGGALRLVNRRSHGAILPDNRGAMTARTRLFFLLPGAVFIALVATFGFFFFRDNFSTHYPIKVLSAGAFRSGEIPWWNFADGGAQPLAGNPNTLTFYPDNVLYLVLPAHVAFNLHFVLHLIAAWFAMRSLTRSRFGAWLWILSGVAMSALSFYNLITAIALIPLALLGAERRNAVQLGIAFGLLALAGEPVIIIATALAVLILSAPPRLRVITVSLLLATAIAAPQLISYAEIASEVERAHGYSAQTVLNASFDPKRLLEVIIGPVIRMDAPHLFPSLMIGLIVIPAILRRSRYTVTAATMLFFALGAFNPLVRTLVESASALRVGRFPQKFAIVMCAALVVLAAEYVGESKTPRIWTIVTFAPLLIWMFVTIPIDWFAPYRVTPQPTRRVFAPSMPGGQTIDRENYRERARRLEPLFGATAGLEYVLNRSGDGMHSLLSRIAAERFAATHNPNWLRIASASPSIVPVAYPAPTIPDAVNMIESGVPVAPRAFTSAPGARVTRVVRDGPTDLHRCGTLGPGAASSSPALLPRLAPTMVNRELA